MSRFFSGYTSDSSSSEEELLSTSEEELISSESEQSDDNLSTDSKFQNDSSDESDSDSDAPKGPSYFLKKNFMKGSKDESDSESDDEGRKIVKSAKEKLLDDMNESIESLAIAQRNENWTNILVDFDKLVRLLVKIGQQNLGTPNSYIKALANLEDATNETADAEKGSKKKMNAAYYRAFNTTRQRLKKQLKEYEPQVALYRSNPDLFDKDEPVINLAMTRRGIGEQNEVYDEGRFSSGTSKVLSPVFTTLKQIAESRGKKNIDKFEQIQILEKLLNESQTGGKPFELICIYQMLLSIRFDASSNQSFMPLDQWKKNMLDLNDLFDLLEKRKDEYQVSESGIVTDDIDVEPPANAEGTKVIFGSITSFIERLDDEFTRSLQATDPHSIEYVERLKDENCVYKLIVRGQLYVETTIPTSERKTEENSQLSRAIMRRLEHIHYKPDLLIKANEEEAWKNIELSSDSFIVSRRSEPCELIEELCNYLCEKSKSTYGKNSLLCKIYYYSINNQYLKARDLFLSSQAYNNINNAESSLQIMYNRALVQLGLSAFKAGAIEDSHQALSEIANSQRLKELLGQGFNTKFPSQATAAEKLKLLPFHMHINLELLECVYMTSSLLIEIPALAAVSSSSKEYKRKASLKSFKSKLEFHDRQYFTGPPESIKDHIVYASRSLQKGDWSKAYNLLASIKIWRLIPETDQLLSMMKKQLQIEGLRTYIFSYKAIYSKLSITKLSAIFSLEKDQVYTVVNKMIHGGDLSGSIDESHNFVVFTNEHQRTKLQELAIIMNEKVGLLTEKNEKTASNGFSRKQPVQQQRETILEETNKLRYANVNSTNDEFQFNA